MAQLGELVRRGEIKPGDRLPPERDLAQAFGVGRPTLRQALTVLAQAGVVEILAGSGVYLRKTFNEVPGSAGHAMAMVLIAENKSLYNILELRVGIEGEAAYLAAQRRTDADVSRLHAAFRALDEAYYTTGMAVSEDYQFHNAIAEATGNPVFSRVMTSLADLFMQQFQETTRSLYHEPDRVLANRREHEEILHAILEQRPEEARLAMIRHLRRVADRLRRAEGLVQE